MTRKESLAELIAKVEAGDIAKAPFWKVWVPEGQEGNLAYTAKQAASGSLDAAKALHEAVLPGWDWEVASPDAAAVFSGHRISGPSFLDVSQSSARAWLLATLRALHSMEPDA